MTIADIDSVLIDILLDFGEAMLGYIGHLFCDCCKKKRQYHERVHSEDSRFGIIGKAVLPYYE